MFLHPEIYAWAYIGSGTCPDGIMMGDALTLN
jgi:hypothetical protein